MDLYSKLKIYLDYSNIYTINKALYTLHKEFDRAELHKNTAHMEKVIAIVDNMQKTIIDYCDEPNKLSPQHQAAIKKITQFLLFLRTKLSKA